MAFGKKRSKTVTIDGKRLSELLEKKGYSPGDACKELGGYTGMMSNAVSRGRLAVGFVDLIREKFGINSEEYVTGEMPAEEAKTAPPPETKPQPEPEPEPEDPYDVMSKALRGIAECAVKTVPSIDYDQLSVSLFWAIDAAIWSITHQYTTGNPVVREIMNMKEKE